MDAEFFLKIVERDLIGNLGQKISSVAFVSFRILVFFFGLPFGRSAFFVVFAFFFGLGHTFEGFSFTFFASHLFFFPPIYLSVCYLFALVFKDIF